MYYADRSRPVCLLLAVCSLALPGWLPAAEQPPQPASSATLRDTFSPHFVMGVAMDGFLPAGYSSKEIELARSQFAALTPANCMKMDHLQRREGAFNFAMADAFVAFAQSNQLKVCGHTLVWAKDDRTPAWVFRDGDKSASRELLLRRMKAHIDSVAGRYRGQILSWDVVNEALDDGTNYIRPSQWLSIGGEDFLVEAFRMAHAADPGAQLVYNDYNVELPGKREKLIRLLQTLKAKGAPIHAVGIQGHWELDAIPYTEIETTIREIQKLGLKVMITEFDIDVIPRSRWWAEGGRFRDEMAKLNPYADRCPPEVLQRQAEQYRRIFEILLRHSGAISRVTFWDLHDGRSWLNEFPWARTNHPLLFDRDASPKPALEAVLGSVRKEL